MNIARLVSELLYAGKTLEEIAGYSTVQMNLVLFLRRDNTGRLVDPQAELPDGVEVDDSGRRVVPSGARSSFTGSFRKTKLAQGLDEAAAQRAWEDYLSRNPSLVALIEQRERFNKRREQLKRQGKQPAGA